MTTDWVAPIDDDDRWLGGDVEVFAVRGAHVTPWHFDSQHNFTVQLRGTKRWSVRAAPIEEYGIGIVYLR